MITYGVDSNLTSTRGRSGGATVLVPTSFGPSCSYPCVRSLGRRGIDVVVGSEYSRPLPGVSRFCGGTWTLPAPRSDVQEYKDALLDVVARTNVCTVIPTREEDAYVLSKYRDEFERHVDLVVPRFETLRSVHDRVLLAAVAEDAGVPVPETRPMDAVDTWDDRAVIKSRYNLIADAYVDSCPESVVDTVKGVHHLAPGDVPDEESTLEEMKHVPIVQEFVPSSDEYVFAALYERGEPLATFQHRQIRGDSYVGGGGVYRKTVFDPELERVGRALLDHLEWNGLACIEYMKHADTGEFVLTEINPRTWQSLPVAISAGADFPYFYWLAARGESDKIDPTYELDRGSHYIQGELGYLQSVLRDESPNVDRPCLRSTAVELLSSVIEDPVFDYAHADDPAPLVYGIRRLLSNRLK